MKHLVWAALAAAAFGLAPMRASADEIGCGIVEGGLLASSPNQVMISCIGTTPEFGTQLAGILTYVLRNRLDPELVIVKLNEIEGAPSGGKPRTLSADQGQAILQGLVGKPGEQIAVVAHPQGGDSSDYAVALATRLAMAGWKIDGNQVRRLVPSGLDDIEGLVLVVHDEKAPPEKALRLKAALAAAKILVPVLSDPKMAADGALLWVGKRPSFNTAPK